MGERCISIFNLIRTNCFIKVLQCFFSSVGEGGNNSTHQTYPKLCLGAGMTQSILGLDWRKNGWNSPLPWVVWVESSKGEHLHNPVHTTDTSAHHHNRYPGWRCPQKEGGALQAQHFERWTFCLTSDPAATRSGYNSPGMDLSNCKSPLLLWDTSYPWMTRSLIAPTALLPERTAVIYPGKSRRWFGDSKRKAPIVIPHLPLLAWICATPLGVAHKDGC